MPVVQNEPVVGPAGGTVNGQGAALGAQLNIPPGALAQQTPVEIGADPNPPPIPEGYLAAGPSVLCSPEGLTFNRPATLLVPYFGAGDVQLYTASGQDGQVWQPVDGGSPDNVLHLVRASITHFSRYQAFRLQSLSGVDAGP
jgi:hypothetical protein